MFTLKTLTDGAGKTQFDEMPLFLCFSLYSERMLELRSKEAHRERKEFCNDEL